MKHFSKYLDNAFHEETSVEASDKKRTKISMRVRYKKQKPKAKQYKILNEYNKIWRIIRSRLTVRRKEKT